MKVKIKSYNGDLLYLSPEKEYEVRFKGSIWTGISEEILSNGEIVKIKEFRGNKIVLERK